MRGRETCHPGNISVKYAEILPVPHEIAEMIFLALPPGTVAGVFLSMFSDVELLRRRQAESLIQSYYMRCVEVNANVRLSPKEKMERISTIVSYMRKIPSSYLDAVSLIKRCTVMARRWVDPSPKTTRSRLANRLAGT